MPLDPMLMRKFHAPQAQAPQPETPPAQESTDAPAAPQPPVRDVAGTSTAIVEHDSVSGVTNVFLPQTGQTIQSPSGIEPSLFKQNLDQLDELIKAEHGLSAFNIDMVRGYVKQIMVDLQMQPDLDAILIDRDVHNVLMFIRHVKDQAVESRTATATKKATKVAKAGRLGDFKFAPLDLGGGMIAPPDLTGLGKIKT